MTKQNENKPDKAQVIIFPPLLFMLTLALAISIGYIFPTPMLPTKLATIIVALLLIAAFVIIRTAVTALLKNQTTVNPNGTTTTIVKTGIYNHTRNPMYVAFTLAFVAISVMTNSWYGLTLIIPLLITVQKGIIEREEKYLTQKFGEDYLRYKNNVNRWF